MPRTQAASPDRGSGRNDGAGSDNHEHQSGRGHGGSSGPVKSSHVIEEHIDVGVPRQAAYDQWTRYQELARYSKKESAEVKRADRVAFRSKIGPSGRQWETQVVEQVPGRRIKWRSIGGAQTLGVVSFHQLDGRLTRVMVEMEYHPKGAVETVGNFFRMQRRRVRKDLRLFKHFIEIKGQALGPGGKAVRSQDGLRQETDDRLDQDQDHQDSGARLGSSVPAAARSAGKRMKEAAG